MLCSIFGLFLNTLVLRIDYAVFYIWLIQNTLVLRIDYAVFYIWSVPLPIIACDYLEDSGA